MSRYDDLAFALAARHLGVSLESPSPSLPLAGAVVRVRGDRGQIRFLTKDGEVVLYHFLKDPLLGVLAVRVKAERPATPDDVRREFGLSPEEAEEVIALLEEWGCPLTVGPWGFTFPNGADFFVLWAAVKRVKDRRRSTHSG